MTLMDSTSTTLHILLCHQTDAELMRMRVVVKAAFPDAKLLCTDNLTQAYNEIEHREPDVLFVAQELASRAEFDLVAALVKILGVGCVLWAQGSTELVSAPLIRHVVFDPRISDVSLQGAVAGSVPTAPKARPPDPPKPSVAHFDPSHILLIGASTGGVDALARILRHFSRATPPTVIVQHTGGQFAKSLIRLLDSVTEAVVQPAEHGAALAAGHVYLPPSDTRHLTLSERGEPRLALVEGPAISGHRPSIDVLFRSAISFRRHVTAALLTGMGQDGARGLLALRDAGAHTITQDKATSVVYGMPRIATEMGAAVDVLGIDAIGPALLRTAQRKARI